MIAWAFGGQGHERPGEGRALLPVIRDRLLEEHAHAIERGGRAWSRTETLQPLLVDLATALIPWAGRPPDRVFGHSLGELSAACAAGLYTRAQGIEIARVRGKAMATVGGGMCAVPIGERHPDLQLAVENPDHDVLAGPRAALRGRVLPVSGAWHTPACASKAYTQTIYMYDNNLLSCQMILGGGQVEARDPRAHLARQVAEPFRFRALMRALDGIEEVVVFPPGRLLASWLRAAGFRVRRLETPDDLEST